MTTSPTPPRLGDLLLRAGVVTDAQLKQALAEQSSWGGRLGQNLVSMGFITDATLAAAVAQQVGLPTVDLDAMTLPEKVTHLLPVGLAERYGMIAIEARDTGAIVVACIDPTNEDAQREARTATQKQLDFCVAAASAVERAIRRHYYGEPPAAQGVQQDPRLNITRHGFESPEPGQSGGADRDVLQRLANLEQQVDALTRAVTELSGGRLR
jgi:type IV pilus assembly protein PilB